MNEKSPVTSSERHIDMQSKEVMQFMQGLKYIGPAEVSKTQQGRLKREAAEKFFGRAMQEPHWQDRLHELWQSFGDSNNFEITGLESKTPKEEMDRILMIEKELRQCTNVERVGKYVFEKMGREDVDQKLLRQFAAKQVNELQPQLNEGQAKFVLELKINEAATNFLRDSR